MGLVKPWHLFVLAMLCLLPTVLAVGAGIWIAYQRKRTPAGEPPERHGVQPAGDPGIPGDS